MSDELIDIVDEDNNLIGVQKMKSEAHRDGSWHRAAHVWIYNSQGEILLQLRAKDKLLCPDMWDISAAGHIGAGEEPVTSAVREIQEEIGISVTEGDLEFFSIHKIPTIPGGVPNNEFDYIYFLKFDGIVQDLDLQKEEVQEARFLTPEKIEEELKENPGKYAPSVEYIGEVISEIRNKTVNNKI